MDRKSFSPLCSVSTLFMEKTKFQIKFEVQTLYFKNDKEKKLFTLRIKVRISFGVKLLPTKNIIYLRTHFKSKLRFFEIIGPNIYKSLSQVLSRVGFFNVLVDRIYS